MKVLCEKCGSVLNSEFIGEKHICPVCGANLDDDSQESQAAPKESNDITWYYYEWKTSGSYFIIEKTDAEKKNLAVEDEDIILRYTFQAPPRDENGSSERAKAILRQKYPNAFAPAPPKPERSNEPKCPRCGSRNIQLVQKKFSIWTGYRTNAVDRICVNCKHKW